MEVQTLTAVCTATWCLIGPTGPPEAIQLPTADMPGLQFKTKDEESKFTQLFSEIQTVVESKQLRPMVRTQYYRTAFQASTGLFAMLCCHVRHDGAG